MKNLSLKVKMALAILLPLFLIMGALSITISTVTYNESYNLSEKYISERIDNEGNKLLAFIEEHAIVAQSLGESIKPLIANKNITRDEMNAMMVSVLGAEPDAIDVWSVFEPNTFDGADAASIGRVDSDEKGRYVGLAYKDGEKIGIDKCYAYDTDAYYLKPKENGKVYVTEPMVYKVGGKDVSMITITAPVMVDGKFIGAVGIDISTDRMSEENNKVKLFETGYMKIISDRGMTIAHPKAEKIGKMAEEFEGTEGEKLLAELMSGKENSGVYYSETLKADAHKIFHPVVLGDSGITWIIGSTIPLKEITVHATQIRNLVFILSVLGLIIIAVIVWVYISALTKSISKMANIAKIVATGDLTAHVEEKMLQKTDELGDMANAFDHMQQSIREMVSEMQSVSDGMSTAAFNLNEVTEQTSITAEDIAKTIEEIARGATEQAKDTEGGSHKAIELGELIEKDLEYLGTVNREANHVMSALAEGKTVFAELGTKTEESQHEMNAIATGILKTKESVDRIKEVSRLIATISEQTNLLALNASIEAARAGEAGRGFAVVADEIRKLAEESRKSTEEIDNAVKLLTTDAENSVKIVDTLKVTMQNQGETVFKTSDRYESIYNAVKTMISLIEDLNTSANVMDKGKNSILEILTGLSAIAEENAASTQETSASTEEQTASLHEIAKMCDDLNEMAKNIKTIANQFKL